MSTSLELLAPLFRYPGAGFREALTNARNVVPEIERFAQEALALDPVALESTYTTTFDLAPICSPYLGVHVFGEDTRKRARLMLGLQRSSDLSELPDHIAEVLAHRGLFEEEEWRDLEELVLVPALMKMAVALVDNPYRLVVDAVLAQVRGGCPIQVTSGEWRVASDVPRDAESLAPRYSLLATASRRGEK